MNSEFNILERSINDFMDRTRQEIKDLETLRSNLVYLEDTYMEYGGCDSTMPLSQKKKNLVIKNNIVYFILKYCNNDIIKVIEKYYCKRANEYNLHMLKSEIEFFLHYFKINLSDDGFSIYYGSLYMGSIELENGDAFIEDNVFIDFENKKFVNANYKDYEYISSIDKYVEELVSAIEEVKIKENEFKIAKDKLNKFKLK